MKPRIPPQGLESMDSVLPWSFAARYRKTGYIVPDHDQMVREYERIQKMRELWSGMIFSKTSDAICSTSERSETSDDIPSFDSVGSRSERLPQ